MEKTLKGQISIFMALIFMVIFALFTMTVSLSMFIHDKINVQNATDLASYYVASKQAELLGAIAHNNYAIRQSYKLMVYRYRVYGNAGRTNELLSGFGTIRHPGNRANWQTFRNDTIYRPATVYNNRPPRVCIGSHHLMREIDSDNQCRTINFSVNAIVPVGSVVGSLVSGINSGVGAINANVSNSCELVAYLNWYYANAIVAAHKYEQRDRRNIINALANNLSRPIELGSNGMVDIEGGNVYQGALHTFVRNLTESNRSVYAAESATNGSSLTIENSMSQYFNRQEDWLVPIYFNAVIPYSHFVSPAGIGSCSEQLLPHNSLEYQNLTGSDVQTVKNQVDPTGNVFFWGGYDANSPPSEEILSLGVEKNPWIMVYNKTEASIFSKPLFLGTFIAPQGIRINAMSYAKPFGGRIGPWYQKMWGPGSGESNSGGKTDERGPNRITRAEYGLININDRTLFPNYSRFPSDPNGMTTNDAMLQAGPVVGWSWLSSANPSGFEPPTSIQDYFFSIHSYHSSDVYNDPLAQDVSLPLDQRSNSFNRRMEIAAIMPDAFDMTYYSISPDYYDFYIEYNGEPKLESWLPPLLDSDVLLRGDIGSHPGQRNFSILDQMFSYNSQSHDGNFPPTGTNDAPFTTGGRVIDRSRDNVPYFFTTDPLALLTGWNKADVPMSYDTPNEGSMDAYFARCINPIVRDLSSVSKPRLPSGCLRGGRFGYSVKLISGDYIRDEHPIGGQRTPGSIENPL